MRQSEDLAILITMRQMYRYHKQNLMYQHGRLRARQDQTSLAHLPPAWFARRTPRPLNLREVRLRWVARSASDEASAHGGDTVPNLLPFLHFWLDVATCMEAIMAQKQFARPLRAITGRPCSQFGFARFISLPDFLCQVDSRT